MTGIALFGWLLIYLPFLNLPFLSDDYVLLSRLQDAHHIIQSGEFFRPVFNMVFFAFLKIFGTTALPFHVRSFSLTLAVRFLSISCPNGYQVISGGLPDLPHFSLQPLAGGSGLVDIRPPGLLVGSGPSAGGPSQIRETHILENLRSLLASLFTIIALLSKEPL